MSASADICGLRPQSELYRSTPAHVSNKPEVEEFDALGDYLSAAAGRGSSALKEGSGYVSEVADTCQLFGGW